MTCCGAMALVLAAEDTADLPGRSAVVGARLSQAFWCDDAVGRQLWRPGRVGVCAKRPGRGCRGALPGRRWRPKVELLIRGAPRAVCIEVQEAGPRRRA